MHTSNHFSRRAAWLAAIVALACAPARADEASDAKQKQLIGVLQAGAPPEKALACKQLAIHGGKEAVPELAKLLADEQLASWARIALEAIPDPAADEALRKAGETLQGKLLVGTLNSIGVRRDAAAVELLAKRLKDPDAAVAGTAAVALGRVGDAAATKTLRAALPGAPAALRSPVAEGCVLCAERLLADDKSQAAAELYDEVRKADVPKPRKIEATRGAILARKSAGIPLLLEQLGSADLAFFRIGLTTARELPGREVAEALAAELGRTTPERGALLLAAMADRTDSVISPAVLTAAQSGERQVRIAALSVIGRAGDATSLSTLLESASDADAELAQTAKTALAALPGNNVNAEIAARLSKADGKTLAVLLEAVGQRRIPATGALVKALDNADPAIRSAALTALGETVTPQELSVLIAQAVSPRNPADAKVAQRALRAACVRMPDRESCATELAAAMPRASVDAKASMLGILGAMGGTKSLETIGAAVRSNEEALQDTGSRLLGEWMSVDAGPVLLDLAKSASADKYQVRALRGYIRLARQFAMPDKQRAEMCQKALEAAGRPEELKLVLAVLERYPNLDTLKVAIHATQTPALKDDASRSAMIMGQKLSASAEAREMLAKVGLEPAKVEILKAEYGAGSTQKDVTEAVRKLLAGAASSAAVMYNDVLGGDPAPQTPKQLKIQYRINGKTGEASFAENAPIALTIPK